MSIGSNPPPSPPMLSPDHKWVWDGTQWQPVADPSDPARQSVFPAFNSVIQDHSTPIAPAQPTAATMPTPMPPSMPLRAPAPAGSGSAAVPLNVRPARSRNVQRPPQLWDRGQTGVNKYLYIGAAAVVVLIGLVLVSQLAPITLPWSKTPDAQSTNAPPTSLYPPAAERSDFARADRMLKGIVQPALSGMNDTLSAVDLGCHGTLTVACASAVPEADRDIKSAIALMDSTASLVPDCIAVGVAGVRRDLAGMDTNLGLMQTSFDRNQTGSVHGYYLRYENGHAALATDLNVAMQEQALCIKDVTGP